jgi:anti-sigma factor RsiW
MTCDECFEAVSASVDGELPADDHEAMNEHLDGCSDCQRLRARLLSLSAEMKGQPFREPEPEAVKALTEAALAGTQPTAWKLPRQILRAPYERWPWRLGLRAASLTAITALVGLSAIVRWILPAYDGVEAVAREGRPDSATWIAWAPDPALLPWLSLLGLLIGAWTCGAPALVEDLWREAKISHRQVAQAFLGMIAIGPFLALPLLGSLELGGFVLACCLWTGLCLLSGFALVAFKSPRPLPQLALDFVALVLPFGLLEWMARVSLKLPGAPECQPAINLLAGSLPFSTLAAGVAVLSGSALLLGCGLSGFVSPYRGAGGRPCSALLVLCGAGCLLYAWSEARTVGGLVFPPQAELRGGRSAYLLASGGANPWLLPSLEYPALQWESGGRGVDPRADRLAVASAYMSWDEAAMLKALTAWADRAPGVTWGLSDFVDSLGRRQGAVLALPTEARQQTVAHLLQRLRWRMLAESVLAQERGVVRGRLEGPGGLQGQKLRLIEVKAGIPEVLDGLAAEVRWAGAVVGSQELGLEFAAPAQRSTVTGPSGEFEFERVPPGRYVLALLPEANLSLTANETLPGVFEVGDGEVRLPDITLSVGSQGHDIVLEPRAWRSEGQVEFSVSAGGPVCQMQASSLCSAFVDGELFHSGTARVKLLATGQPAAGAALSAKILARDGRLIAETTHPIDSSGLQELVISSHGRDGYLQIAIVSGQGSLQVRGVRVEVLP